MEYFITGTDTDAGKTYVTCLLLNALTARRECAAGFKPVTCGDQQDAEALAQASVPQLTRQQVNPCAYKSPAAPLAAGWIENHTADPDAIIAALDKIRVTHPNILIEGAGGWEVPLAPGLSMADLAVKIGAPVILVVANRLGALNHTILTVKSIQQSGLTCAGIILNHVADERDSASISNRAVLEQVLPDIPILADILHGETEIDWPL
jgi:dethiobiotin synthetase